MLPKLQTSIGLFAVTAFTISLTMSSCTPEKRAMLRVTAENFRNQAVEAITSFREINQLQLRDSATDDLDSTIIVELLNNPILENHSQLFQQLDLIILGDKNEPSKLDVALDNLQAEYDQAVEVFTNLEEIDYGSPQIVAQTAQPVRCLTVKMLLIAQLLQQNPPHPKNPERVEVALQLMKLRQKYRQTNISESEKKEIENQVAGLIKKWRNLDVEEKEMIKLTMSKLILAAEKGQKISKLIDEYPNLSFDVISTRITQILGLTSNITGKDYSYLTSKINTIKQEITKDQTLNEFFTEVINAQSKPDKSQLKCQF